MIRKVRTLVAGTVAGAVFSLLSPVGLAAIILKTESFEGNDCAGTFGSPFADCAVPNPAGGDPLSAVMAKFDYDADPDVVSVNTGDFPTLTTTGDEFDIDFIMTNGGTGTFEYDQGTGDPDLRYWVAKAGNGFILYYYVDDAIGTARGDALAVTAGEWTTPLNNQGDPRGLSHITFYDTEGGGTTTEVPEPAILSLAGLALLGAGLFRRRRG